jgi:hypothetical protein
MEQTYLDTATQSSAAQRLRPLLLSLAFLFCGGASSWAAQSSPIRSFDYQHDTFSYSNQLTWDYGYDKQGKWTSHRHEPRPEYTLHCFVVVRSADQFFINARFDPQQPQADEATYRRLVRRVVRSSLRYPLPDSKRIVIPGYADLREFSGAKESLLKEECGGAWQGYVQRGNWRIVMPFSRRGQARMAQQLEDRLKAGFPPLVHLTCFPHLTINHGMLLTGAKETADEILFTAYDPNDPNTPATITYNRCRRTFTLPANRYFAGGRVDVYQIYRNWIY